MSILFDSADESPYSAPRYFGPDGHAILSEPRGAKPRGFLLALARNIQERTVNNPGLHGTGHSWSEKRPGGISTEHLSCVHRDGCSVERPQGCLIIPGAPITRASAKPALFAGFIRE